MDKIQMNLDFLQPKDAWEELPLAKKAEMMEVAVRNGITDLATIRQMYNKFAEGGNIYDGESQSSNQMITTGGTGYIPDNYGQSTMDAIRGRLYKNITPFGYHNPISRTLDAIALNQQDDTRADENKKIKKSDPQASALDAIWATYLNIPENQRRKINSRYGISKTKDGYYRFNNPGMIFDFERDLSSEGLYSLPGRKAVMMSGILGNYTTGLARDKKGDYMFYSDSRLNPDGTPNIKTGWDINPYSNTVDGDTEETTEEHGQYGQDKKDLSYKIGKALFGNVEDISMGIGTPVPIYDKIYLDDYYDLSQEHRGGLYLPNITVYGNKHSDGGNLFGGGSYMDKAKALIKDNEKWRKMPYNDAPEGKTWKSVGYGFNDSGFYDKYPEGISNHYKNGITKAQAEEELNWYLNRADQHLRKMYGSKWDTFTDGQKAAVLDTYYQRPASVAKGSLFYNTTMSGKETMTPGVSGYSERNRKRKKAFLGLDTPSTSVPAFLQPSMDNVAVFNPYALQQQNAIQLPQYVPSETEYIKTIEVSPEQQRAIQLQERFDQINRFNQLMKLAGIENTAIPAFMPETGVTMLNDIWDNREYAKGGKIYIKPSHRGRFTELKKRTGKSASWFKAHGTPAQKKMATFALNARKWKHGLGGNLYDGESEESQQMETMLSPHVELAYTNPWLYSKLHPAKDRDEEYKPTTFAGRVSQAAGGDDLTQKYVDYTSSVIQQVPGIGIIPSALDLGYDVNRMYHNPSISTTKDVALDAASLLPALKKTMKGWWMKGNSGTFVTENGQTFINPRVASALEVALQPYRTAVNTGIYAGRAADFIDDSKAFLKDMYNDSPIGKHFPIKALGGNLFDGTTQPSQKMKIGKPYYSYDENGRKIDDTLNYNISFPEIVITPDSRKSPAEQAILERERRRAHDAYFGNGTYNAKLDKEQTELEKAASNNVWKNSFEGKFLDKGKSITSGVKTAAGFIPVTGDIIQGLDATKDAVSGDYLSAGLGLGMLAVPNLIEKPLKYLGKGIKSVFELTDNQWDEMYNAAIKANDVEEAQRLRDLHFMAKAPDTAIANEGLPIHAYHGTGKQFNEFDTTGKYSTLDEGYYGLGAYFAPNKEIADMYADTERTPIVYDTYLNIKDPLKHVRDENADLYGKPIVNNDGVISTLPDDLIDPDFDMTEFVATKPNQIKKADAITYDDTGNIIPLSQRDNFALGDMRYGLLPFGIGLTGYGLFNNQEAFGGRIKKRRR